ncbi:MAG: hypothetical protein SOY47_16015 [Lachnospiraceae bacterium]|nr:hypothetical protein [Lachnospiraceae bacterium]
MTEQEGIEVLTTLKGTGAVTGEEIDAIDAVDEAMFVLEQYRAIGTVDECRAAVEKQKTIKPHKNFEKFSGVWCSCGKYLGKGYFVDKPNYCPDCGQKLDWRDEE